MTTRTMMTTIWAEPRLTQLSDGFQKGGRFVKHPTGPTLLQSSLGQQSAHVPDPSRSCDGKCLLSACRACRVRSRQTLQKLALEFCSLYLGPEQMATDPFSQGLNRATAAGRQSESPSICTSLENTALLCLLCRGSVAQSTSCDSDHWYISNHTSPWRLMCSDLTKADSGQAQSCLQLTFNYKAHINSEFDIFPWKMQLQMHLLNSLLQKSIQLSYVEVQTPCVIYSAIILSLQHNIVTCLCFYPCSFMYL